VTRRIFIFVINSIQHDLIRFNLPVFCGVGGLGSYFSGLARLEGGAVRVEPAYHKAGKGNQEKVFLISNNYKPISY
jgi:hypothetical protein